MACKEAPQGGSNCNDGYLYFTQADRWISSRLQRFEARKWPRALTTTASTMCRQHDLRLVWNEFLRLVTISKCRSRPA